MLPRKQLVWQILLTKRLICHLVFLFAALTLISRLVVPASIDDTAAQYRKNEEVNGGTTQTTQRHWAG